MKMEVKVSGCPYEDSEQLKTFFHASDFSSAVYEAKESIRSRLKYTELDDDEYRYLEELAEILTIEPIEN